MLHAEQSRRRFDQTASRLRSLAHPAVVGPARLRVSPRTQRIGWDEADGLGYREAQLGEEFGPLWATFWFRIEFQVPAEWDAEPVHLLWDSGCEATAWRDGAPIQGLNGGGRAPRTSVPLADGARAGERFEVRIEIACNPWTGSPLPPIECIDADEIEGRRLGSAWTEPIHGPSPYRGAPARLRQVALARFDAEAWDLGWDFEILRELEAEHDRGIDPQFAGRLRAALDRFCVEWDPGDRSGWAQARVGLRELLAERGPARNHRVIAVGHTHLDTAWLWPFAETRRKFVRSVANQLALMDRYPAHRFAASSAQHYSWLAEDAPDLFARVRERISEGRWSVVGGSWVESDCNLPSGESLLRQFLYGQRWFERELGVRCREHWSPDTFGHTGALPQILGAVGIDRWTTQKLSWNQLTQPPHHSFVWEGIDGSTVLAHMPPSNTCNAEVTVRELRESVERFRDPDRSDVSLLMFGYGDGGGGPTPGMVERAQRLTDLRGLPRLELGTSDDFFDLLEADSDRLGKLVGELYLEFHRGTYTTQLRTKQGNRRGEMALGEAEAAAALAARAAGAEYPALELERLWQTLLRYQFHDVLPGTSIAEVHEEAKRDHAELIDRAGALRDAALGALTGDEQTRIPVNLAPFPRTEVTRDPDSGALALVEAPAYGFGERARAVDDSIVRRDDGGILLENAAIRATLDARGRVTSLVERESGREALAGPGNVFELYEDRPTSYDAWELEPYHRDMLVSCAGADSMQVTEEGPLRAEVVYEHAIGRASRIRQAIRLDAHAGRLEFATTIDWGERHRILKVRFPALVRASSATYETAFGVHERATHENTPFDAARYEVPGHRFVDLGEHGFGLAVLTDSTYGYSTAGSEIRLSLLRSPTDPAPRADLGLHELAYALMPHRNSWREAGVVGEARLFNLALTWVEGSPPEGAASRGFVSVESGDLVCDSIKRAEDGTPLVLRLYEPHGGRGTARVRVALPFASARLGNALEEPLGGELEVEDGALVLPYRPFELLTVLVD